MPVDRRSLFRASARRDVPNAAPGVYGANGGLAWEILRASPDERASELGRAWAGQTARLAGYPVPLSGDKTVLVPAPVARAAAISVPSQAVVCVWEAMPEPLAADRPIAVSGRFQVTEEGPFPYWLAEAVVLEGG